MSPTPVPSRITIDFRGSLMPSRAWILGVGGGSARVELLAFEDVPGREAISVVAMARPGDACTCPEFCELDHANE